MHVFAPGPRHGILAVSPAPCARRPPPSRPARARAGVRLIERRIGFVFAVFLALLTIGGMKAAWLGVVKAGTLKRAATTQQDADITVPARRGAIEDRDG